jgi:hypothetical protein
MLTHDSNDGIESDTAVRETVGIVEDQRDGRSVATRLAQEILKTRGARASINETFRRFGCFGHGRTNALKVQTIEKRFPIGHKTS